jgi:hypothetical protein
LNLPGTIADEVPRERAVWQGLTRWLWQKRNKLQRNLAKTEIQITALTLALPLINYMTLGKSFKYFVTVISLLIEENINIYWIEWLGEWQEINM